jgi:hypothetical protein
MKSRTIFLADAQESKLVIENVTDEDVEDSVNESAGRTSLAKESVPECDCR